MTFDFQRLSPWLWGGLWLVLTAGALVFRPLLPVDETRYLSVAWEMWLRNDYLVPHLNGATYSHKPPLLFWLMNAGWNIFGITEWWPRLVAPAFGLGCLFLTARLGKRLWPESQAYLIAPLLLLGTFYWSVYTTLTMFDLLICLWTLVGLHGLLDVLDAKPLRGWAFFAVAIGMGVLSKGPVILVFLLPAALYAPYWSAASVSWLKWYAGTVLATICGAGIALSWALPAGFAGGAEYRNAIFWGQSAGRVVSSFAHGKPFWWYLAILPGLLLPWLIWPTLWKTVWNKFRNTEIASSDVAADPKRGVRLTIIWAVVTVAILSAISGKRPHYLLPMFPALALLIAFLVATHANGKFVRGRWDVLPIAGITLAFGTALLFAPEIAAGAQKAEWVDSSVRLWAIPLFVVGGLLIWRPPAEGIGRMVAFAAMNALIVVEIHAVASPALKRAYDLHPVAAYVAEQQKKGVAVANFGKYHGQFNFLGRLTKPVTETGQGEVEEWLKATPQAKIISYYDTFEPEDNPELTHPFRSKIIAIWDRATILSHPLIATRNSNARRIPPQ